MRPVRWMLPACGRPSKAASPCSGPRVSGFRASWSRPCRCSHAPVHTGPLQLRRSSRGRQDRGLDPSRSGSSAFQLNSSTWKVPRAPDPRPGREAGERTAPGSQSLGRGAPHRTRTLATTTAGERGELDSGQHQAAGRTRTTGAARCRRSDHDGDVLDASAAAQEGDVGVVRRPVASRIVAQAMRFDSSTFRESHQALSVQWSGRRSVEPEITGSSPVRSAQHATSPHGLAAQDARFSSGRPPVRIRLGIRSTHGAENQG